ncbi:MAG: hypothetical protein AB7P13_04855 [Candidatus Nitrosocosmicus sp.]
MKPTSGEFKSITSKIAIFAPQIVSLIQPRVLLLSSSPHPLPSSPSSSCWPVSF